MAYTLSLGKPEAVETAPYGQFTLIRPFVLKGPPRPNGFIVQRIDRTINVTVHEAKPRTLTTTAEISSFTSGNVENAADSYYELFVVQDGQILDRDQFQSGQVLRYVAGGPDDNPRTSGTITITGTSVFRPAPPEVVGEAATKIKLVEDGVTTRNQTKFEALGETWDTFQGTPANGLPYLKTSTKDPLADAASNRLIHTTTVTWTKDGKDSAITDTAKVGGRRRRTIRARAASRSYRKRRTGRATRRSQGRA